MELVALNDLPQHSAWAASLLDPSRDPPSTPGAYTETATYDDIYAYLLEQYREHPVAPETFANEIKSRGRENPDVISIDEHLYLATTAELLARERSAVRDALHPMLTGGETVVDLGCGWGATLGVIAKEFPTVTVVGGEVSQPGVALARELYSDTDRISVVPFDFHGEWDLLPEGDAVVFTRGALTTLDDVEPVIDRLAARAAADDIVGGVHLEETGPHPDTLLGLLRQRYATVNDYNTDIVSVLSEQHDLSVTAVEYDVIGANPLHPSTAVQWRPM